MISNDYIYKRPISVIQKEKIETAMKIRLINNYKRLYRGTPKFTIE